MTDADLIAEVERRGREAHKTKHGPDYRAIVRAVADENGVPYEHLRGVCLDAWTAPARAS